MRYILTGLLLLYSAYTDIRRREISIIALLLFGIGACICMLCGRSASAAEIAGGAATGIFLLFISHLTRGELGEGDGCLLAVTGILLGFRENLMLLFGALFLSAVFSAFLFLVKRNLRDKYPFVPFLFLSYSIMMGGGVI